MNTLSARMNGDETYSIPHADFLRLQHAHGVGVTVLDMFSLVIATGDRRHVPDGEALASVIALLTDQLGKVVDTCEKAFLEKEIRHDR